MKTVFLFLLATFIVQFGNAQFTMSPDTYNGMANIALNAEINRVTIGTISSADKNSSLKDSKPAGSSSNSMKFLFTPDSRVSAKVRQAIIDNEKRRTPATKLEEALSGRNNPFPAYVRLLKTLGLDVQHNYADAFTAYLLGMWRIANGMGNNPTSGQINAVRRQVAQNVTVDGFSNLQKQEAAEYMIYDLIFANEPYEGSRKAGDQRQMKLDSDAVHQRFLNRHNIDLRKMIITDKGLTAKM